MQRLGDVSRPLATTTKDNGVEMCEYVIMCCLCACVCGGSCSGTNDVSLS